MATVVSLPPQSGELLRAPIDHYRSLRIAVWKEDWPEVTKLARQAIRLGERTAIADTRINYSRLRARRERGVDRFVALLQDLVSSRNGRAALVKAHEHLQQTADADRPLVADIGKLAEGRARKASALESLKELRRVSFRREVGHAAVGLAAKGLHALAIAEFNKAFLRASRSEEAADLTALRQSSSRALAQLRSLQRTLHRAATPVAAKDACRAIVKSCRVAAPELARAQGAAVAALWAQHSGHRSRPSRFMAPLLRAAEVLRECLASHAAALRWLHDLDSPDGERRTVLEVLVQGKTVAFAPRRGLGGAVGPKAFETGRVVDGQEAVVEGVVTGLTASRNSARELIGRMRLREANGGASVTVVAKFVHLGHIGITVGGVVRAAGKFKLASPMAGRAAAIEVKRQSLAEDSLRSWHTAFLQSGDPYYRWAPNGIALDWSYGPQLRARGKWPTDYLGAGEVLWAPLVATRAKNF